MTTIPAGVRVLLATRPVDFCKGAHGLAALAAEVLVEDPFPGVVIVYRAKRAGRVKLLVGWQWPGAGVEAVAAGCVSLAADRGRRDAAFGRHLEGEAWARLGSPSAAIPTIQEDRRNLWQLRPDPPRA